MHLPFPENSDFRIISSKMPRPHLTEQDESFEDLSNRSGDKQTYHPRKSRKRSQHYKRELAASRRSRRRQKRDKLEEQRDRIIREANEKAHDDPGAMPRKQPMRPCVISTNSAKPISPLPRWKRNVSVSARR